LRISLSHLNESSRRRVVLFTDGGQTTGDAADALKRVVSMGADVWIVPLSQGNDAEMLIDKIVIPNELRSEEHTSELQSLTNLRHLPSFPTRRSSDLLRISLSHLNESSRRRVVLFTDGGQTTGDAADALKRVVSMGADVWIVPLSQGNDAEMLIDKIVIPNELRSEERRVGKEWRAGRE